MKTIMAAGLTAMLYFSPNSVFANQQYNISEPDAETYFSLVEIRCAYGESVDGKITTGFEYDRGNGRLKHVTDFNKLSMVESMLLGRCNDIAEELSRDDGNMGP